MPLSLGVGVGLRHSRVTDEAGVIRARSADIIYTGQTPSIIVDRLIDATSAGITYTGQTANVDVRTTIAATSAGITYTGQTATVSVGGGSAAETLAGSETDALAIVYTDDFHKATTGFNGSVYCLDSGTPANDYDSSPTTEAASYFTYTSPSPKMILHDDGVLKYAAHNLYLNSASPANQSITVVSSATYAVTITGSVSVTASGAATGTWTAGTNTFTAATTTLTLGSTSGSGTVHVRRTPSDSTYMETAGSIRYADPVEFNSSGTSLGLLVEPQRTNLLTYNTQFDNAAWTKTASNITANAATAPNGVSQADKFYVNGATAEHLIYQTEVCTAQAYTWSVCVAAAEYTNVQLRLYVGNNNWEAVTFNLSTGAVSQSQSGSSTAFSSVSSAIVDVDGTFYRCSVTATCPAATVFCAIDLVSSSTPTLVALSGGVSMAGDSTSGVYIWGAQLEAGSSATSPIETYGSTVTRAADNISKASSAFPDATANMTLYARWTPRGLAASGANTQPVNLNNNTTGGTASLFALYTNSSGDVYTFLNNSSGTQANIDSGSNVSLGTSLRAACAYASNNVNIAVNGTAGTADTSAGVMNSITTLNVGSGELGGAGQLNGHIQEILILPRRVSDADMQTLTSTGALP